MNLLLPLLQIYTPMCVKKRALKELFNFTAAAFGCQVPPIEGLSPDECLYQYTMFTQGHVEAFIRDGHDLQALQERLYVNAYQLGQMHGQMLRVRNIEEVMAMGRILYRILGIEFHGNAQGGVVISHCYFSGFYSGQVCRIMSAMDQGLFAGLSGGGQLVFTSRITEGQPCCRARFTFLQEGAK